MPGKVAEGGPAPLPDAATSFPYHIYTTDDHGTLSLSLPAEEAKVLLKTRASPDYAVHRVARGELKRGVQVLALARHNGNIDIVALPQATLLLTLPMAHMRKNIHRWVGLAVAENGIYSATSAGDFAFTPLDEDDDGSLQALEAVSLQLSEPLQCLQFEPQSDPRYFAYGGETTALSVWDVKKALEGQQQQPSQSSNPEAGEDDLPEPGQEAQQEEGEEEEEQQQQQQQQCAKGRKRRRGAERRSKANELHPGEIWRAKNLPNSPIGLVNKPSILSIAFISETKLAVGTRQGELKLYQVGLQRKSIKEIRLFTGKDPVKHLVRSFNEGELVAADNTGRVCVVDYRSGVMLYKYEQYVGAALNLCPVPPSRGSKASFLISSSAEKLLRIHDVPHNSNVTATKTKQNGKILSTVFQPAGVRSIIWDGNLPQDSDAALEEDEEGTPSLLAQEAADGPDDLWQNMAVVGEDEGVDEHRKQRRRIEGSS